jgi:hypothetical protein
MLNFSKWLLGPDTGHDDLNRLDRPDSASCPFPKFYPHRESDAADLARPARVKDSRSATDALQAIAIVRRYVPTAERTVGPARNVVDSLPPRPGIRERHRPTLDIGRPRQWLTGCKIVPLPPDRSSTIRYPTIRPRRGRSNAFDQLKRRDFITFIGGAAAAGPERAFHQGLKESGFVEGENVAIVYHFAENQIDRLPALAADLVRRRIAVTVALQGTILALSAKAATATVPVVSSGRDPVQSGLVTSLNWPGVNVTGVTFLVNLLAAKRLELLRELVSATVVGDLVNPTNPNSEGETKGMQAACALGQQLHSATASSERDVDAAFAIFAQQQVNALIITADALFHGSRYGFGTTTSMMLTPVMSHQQDHAVLFRCFA